MEIKRKEGLTNHIAITLFMQIAKGLFQRLAQAFELGSH
jgi:hypothetical protein